MKWIFLLLLLVSSCSVSNIEVFINAKTIVKASTSTSQSNLQSSMVSSSRSSSSSTIASQSSSEIFSTSSYISSEASKSYSSSQGSSSSSIQTSTASSQNYINTVVTIKEAYPEIHTNFYEYYNKQHMITDITNADTVHSFTAIKPDYYKLEISYITNNTTNTIQVFSNDIQYTKLLLEIIPVTVSKNIIDSNASIIYTYYNQTNFEYYYATEFVALSTNRPLVLVDIIPKNVYKYKINIQLKYNYVHKTNGALLLCTDETNEEYQIIEIGTNIDDSIERIFVENSYTYFTNIITNSIKNNLTTRSDLFFMNILTTTNLYSNFMYVDYVTKTNSFLYSNFKWYDFECFQTISKSVITNYTTIQFVTNAVTNTSHNSVNYETNYWGVSPFIYEECVATYNNGLVEYTINLHTNSVFLEDIIYSAFLMQEIRTTNIIYEK